MTETRPRTISIIVAVAENGVIGRDNALVWRLRSDLRRFRSLTMGKPVIMGRRTWDAIGRPLPGRRVIVMTRDRGWSSLDVVTAVSWDDALRQAGDVSEVMIAGGSEIYGLALPQADRIYLTRVSASPDGDAVFPDVPRGVFRETFREAHPAGPDDEHAFCFVTLDRHV
ncbi:MAG: dihydrofolate reductase [Methylobacterium frigidaeris]